MELIRKRGRLHKKIKKSQDEHQRKIYKGSDKHTGRTCMLTKLLNRNLIADETLAFFATTNKRLPHSTI